MDFIPNSQMKIIRNVKQTVGRIVFQILEMKKTGNLSHLSLPSPRIMRFEKKSLDGLGVEVSGGYRVGIYVIELQENSICKAVGLQVGDRLLKVKNENFFSIVFLSLFYIWCFYKQIIKR